MKIKPLIGPYGKLPILIRDDDTNFFTRPDMLETIHSKAWDKGFTKLSEFPSRTVANPHLFKKGCNTWNLRRLITKLSNTTTGDA